MIEGRHEISSVSAEGISFSPGTPINVLIATRNGERTIGHVIDNLFSQPLPENTVLNLTICANGCTDQTVDVVREAYVRVPEAREDIQTQLIESDTPGHPHALNTMIRELDEPEIVIALNDDVFPSMGSLQALYLAMVENPELGAIGIQGRPIPTYRHKKASFAEKVGVAMINGQPDGAIGGNMCAFRPKAIGEFPDILSEDVFLTFKSLSETGGYGIVNIEGENVYYFLPKSLTDLVRDTVIHKTAERQFERRYPEHSDDYGALKQASKRRGIRNRFSHRLVENSEYSRSTRLTAVAVYRLADLITGFNEIMYPQVSAQYNRVNKSA